MASSSHCSCWEAPTFHFNSPDQSEDWSTYYTRALDYLDTLDIELDTADESHKGWKQLKLMFEGEDRKALQSLIDSSVMTPEHMLKPKAALDVIGTTIKSEEHFWAYRDVLMSDLWQLPDEGIHALVQCICDLITKSKFGNAQTIETIKIMILQHAVKYHEARDWIRLQDQSQLMYQALLSHCKMLEAHCEQYQKAKERGHANLASISTATSSLHIDAMSRSQPSCYKCGYPIPMVNVQLKVNSAMCAVAITTTLHCAKRRDTGNPGKISSREALSPASATPAMDAATATPHIGTTTAAIASTVIPGPLPAALPIVLPVVHPLGTPPVPKGALHPTGTSRIL